MGLPQTLAKAKHKESKRKVAQSRTQPPKARSEAKAGRNTVLSQKAHVKEDGRHWRGEDESLRLRKWGS